ncbi:hypothetical protein M9H77_16604 [Catharanthus roseus]|uniref:Uncharacterized protein n=1 Tax=Catharanthus roseus TaxID=4058 RepID=A0ACC0B273_CATRO|nr:hypothetical protein M9H77_16604 [Catharanthus roseus]
MATPKGQKPKIKDKQIKKKKRKKPSMGPKASSILKLFMTFLVTSIAISELSMASDPELLTDFEYPSSNSSTTTSSPLNSNYFRFTGARSLVGAPPPKEFNALLANFKTFPALFGQGVSVAVFRFPCGGINPIHSHPRSAEVFVLISGNLEVGFVDTKNKLYNKTIEAGDMFVFPKGLAHYQFNFDVINPAIAVSVYASANAGVVSIPVNLFTSGIDDAILAKSFKTDVSIVRKIKTGLFPNLTKMNF